MHNLCTMPTSLLIARIVSAHREPDIIPVTPCLELWKTPDVGKSVSLAQADVPVLGPGRFGLFNFSSIRFGFQSQVLGFGFGIRTPPRSKCILVCENTKMESTYFDEKFSSKLEVYRPTTLSVKEFFFTLDVATSFTLGVVSLSVDLSQFGRI